MYEFDGFRLDPRRRLLRAPATLAPVDLPPRVFDLLVLLVERAGHLIEKRTLLDRLWLDTTVEENSLERNVSLLRRALRTHGAASDHIVTERGRGYRFTALVSRKGSPSTREAALTLLAVLPFANLTGEPALSYFVDGLSDEVTHALHRSGSQVLSARTASAGYRRLQGDTRALGRELGAEAFVEGNVRRIDGRLRITAHLVSAATGVHVWSHSVEQPAHQIVRLQGELASLVTAAVGSGAVHEADRQFTQVSDRAYHTFLQARALRLRPSRDNIARAEELLTEALTIEPAFGRALGERAMLSMLRYAIESERADLLARAERDALDALALDPNVAHAHQALAQAAIARGRWVEAREHADAALALTGDTDVTALLLLMILQPLGHVRYGYEQALRLVPAAVDSAAATLALSCAHRMVGEDDAARGYAELAITMGATAIQPALCGMLGTIACRKGDHAAGVDYFLAACGPALRSAGAADVLALFADALRADRRERAIEALVSLSARVNPAALHHDYVLVPLWLTLLDAADAVFDYFEHTLPQRRTLGTLGPAWLMLWTPESDCLRRHPRFSDLVGGLGFIEYWRRYGAPDGFALKHDTLVRLGD